MRGREDSILLRLGLSLLLSLCPWAVSFTSASQFCLFSFHSFRWDRMATVGWHWVFFFYQFRNWKCNIFQHRCGSVFQILQVSYIILPRRVKNVHHIWVALESPKWSTCICSLLPSVPPVTEVFIHSWPGNDTRCLCDWGKPSLFESMKRKNMPSGAQDYSYLTRRIYILHYQHGNCYHYWSTYPTWC